MRDYSFWSRVWARRGPTPDAGCGPDAGRRQTRADALSSFAGHTYDDLRQGMSEQMLEMLMWARINSEKRLSARSA